MDNILIYSAADSPAALHAVSVLSWSGISFIDHPTPDATHLLLDVPAHADPTRLLPSLPDDIVIIGGNLSPQQLSGHRYYDLLSDELYLTENAQITAECALSILMQNGRQTLCGSRILIIGWGRIGKQLARLLSPFRADLHLLSRTPSHLAEAYSFGITAWSPEALLNCDVTFDFIVNTAPDCLLPGTFYNAQTSAIKVDLASRPGITCADVISARGLPGRMAPSSSGALIAKSILRKFKEGAL